MSDDDTFSVNLPYYSKVRWLSRTQILVKIFILREQILSFYKEQDQPCDLLDKEFCGKPVFLCDITAKQNDFKFA